MKNLLKMGMVLAILFCPVATAKAVIEYVSEPWKTLVVPINIEDLPAYFGLDYEGIPAVDVLELQGIEDGVITTIEGVDYYSCKLIFTPVYEIVAYKPYLFRVNRADSRAIDELYSAEGERACQVTTVNDPDNLGISVSMDGTVDDGGYFMVEDGLSFYFGYNDRNDTYNFYKKSAYIPKNRCWFYVNDERKSGSRLIVTFDMEGLTGIGHMVNAHTENGKTYNLNGQQVQGKLQKGIYIVNGKKVLVK